MNEVKIFFIIIGTFFMREQPTLVAEKAIISIDPQKKEVVITQHNLISTSEEQDVSKTEELLKLKNKEINWVEELTPFKNKSLQVQENGNSVSLTLSFQYDDPKDLEAINIGYNDSEYSVFLEEKLVAKSGNSQISEPYVLFKENAPFSFEVGIFDEWLDPNSTTPKFNPEFIGQPLVMKKSDAIKGKSLSQISEAAKYGTPPSYVKNGLNLFFAEDQDFLLLNEEVELEVSYLDNNTVLIPIEDAGINVAGLNKGDNYFVYQVDEMNGNLTLLPSDKSGNILKDKQPLYFSTIPKEG